MSSSPNLREYLDICLEGLLKGIKALSPYSLFPGRHFEQRPPEKEAGVLTARQRR
jgi:hypothetical protein